MTDYKDKIGEKYKKILFIHGWGFNGKIWEDFVKIFMSKENCVFLNLYECIENANGDFKMAAKNLLDEHKDVDLIISWSLGCYLAKEFELLTKINSIKMVYVSYSPRFMKSRLWDFGFEQNTIDKLRDNLSTDLIKTLKNFYLLILGNYKNKKEIYKRIIANINLMAQVDFNNLSTGLKIIQDSDYRNFCTHKGVRNLYIYGDNDDICPPEMRKFVEVLEPISVIKVISESSHIPFLTNPEDFFKILKEYI